MQTKTLHTSILLLFIFTFSICHAKTANEKTKYLAGRSHKAALKANILGVPFVTANVTASWSAEVSGGVPPYSYSWKKKVIPLPYPIFLGQNHSCNTKSDKSFVLNLVVKDHAGNSVVVEKSIQINPLAPINADITGPDSIYLDETSLWKVAVTGGQPPYKIDWVKKSAGVLSYIYFGNTGFEYQKYYGGEMGVYYLKTIVKDAFGNIKESQPFKVTALVKPLYIAILNEGNIVIKEGENIEWKGGVSGGKPPYSCKWDMAKDIGQLGIEQNINGINTINAVGEKSEPVKFTSMCNTSPYFNTAGKYVATFTIKDSLNKKMTVSKKFTVISKDKGSNFALQQSVDNAVFSVSPNPANSVFMLTFELKEEAEIAVSLISTRDNRETPLLKQRYATGRHQKTFSTSQYESGTYALKFIKKDKRGTIVVHTEKIVLLK